MIIEEGKRIFETSITANVENYPLLIGYEYIGLKDFVSQLIFELVADQFIHELPTAALLEYSRKESDGVGAEAAYAAYKRNHDAALKYQNSLRNSLGLEPLVKDHDAARRQGYLYNALQVRQMKTNSDLAIIKAMLMSRMAVSKKISRDQFRSLYNEYDQYIRMLIEDAQANPEILIINAIDFYHLQNSMHLELIYSMAVEMERARLDEYPFLEASRFVIGLLRYDSNNGKKLVLQNRFLLHHKDWFPYVFGDRRVQHDRQCSRLYHLLLYKKQLMDDYHTVYPNNHFEYDSMVEFVRSEYNPFSIFNGNKEWSDNRLDLARKILKAHDWAV